MTRDHVVPKSKGGREGRNIVPACERCNGDKADLFAREWAAQLEEAGDSRAGAVREFARRRAV